MLDISEALRSGSAVGVWPPRHGVTAAWDVWRGHTSSLRTDQSTLTGREMVAICRMWLDFSREARRHLFDLIPVWVGPKLRFRVLNLTFFVSLWWVTFIHSNQSPVCEWTSEYAASVWSTLTEFFGLFFLPPFLGLNTRCHLLALRHSHTASHTIILWDFN